MVKWSRYGGVSERFLAWLIKDLSISSHRGVPNVAKTIQQDKTRDVMLRQLRSYRTYVYLLASSKDYPGLGFAVGGSATNILEASYFQCCS